MREIKYIVLHCTATPQNTTIESIRNYWKNVLKWKNVGYHFIIDRAGNFTKLADLKTITNGVKGYNKNSIHIAYIGGIDDKGRAIDNRTIGQKYQILYLLRRLKTAYPLAKIMGHRDFPNVKKACPCFDAKNEYADIFDYI